MNVPKRENFALSKAKIVNGGLEAEYELTEIVGDDPCTTGYKITNSRLPHPDLPALFQKLRGIVGRVMGVTAVLEHLQSEQYPAMSGVEKFLDGVCEQYDVRGISWSGSGAKEAVIISSVFTTASGLKCAVNTPRLPLNSETFGFEEELSEIIGRIKDEVFAYLFEGKQAQLSLFGQE